MPTFSPVHWNRFSTSNEIKYGCEAVARYGSMLLTLMRFLHWANCFEVIASQFKSAKLLGKFSSAMMVRPVFHDTSRMPLRTAKHSPTISIGSGGVSFSTNSLNSPLSSSTNRNLAALSGCNASVIASSVASFSFAISFPMLTISFCLIITSVDFRSTVSVTAIRKPENVNKIQNGRRELTPAHLAELTFFDILCDLLAFGGQIRDIVLLVRRQYAKMVELIGNFIDFRNGLGVPIAPINYDSLALI